MAIVQYPHRPPQPVCPVCGADRTVLADIIYQYLPSNHAHRVARKALKRCATCAQEVTAILRTYPPKGGSGDEPDVDAIARFPEGWAVTYPGDAPDDVTPESLETLTAFMERLIISWGDELGAGITHDELSVLAEHLTRNLLQGYVVTRRTP